MTFLPGKQVQPSSGLLTNIPAPGTPGNLDQYLAQINKGLASSKYLVGANAPYTTIQSAINAAVADGASPANPAVITVTPGYYAENLTLTGGAISIVSQSGNSETATANILGNITCVDPGLPPDFPAYYLYGFYIGGAVTLSGTASGSTCPLFLEDVYLDGSFLATDTVTNTVTPSGPANGALYVLENVTIAAAPGFVAIRSAVPMNLGLSAPSRIYGVAITTGANVFGTLAEFTAAAPTTSPFDVVGFVNLTRATFAVGGVPVSLNVNLNSTLVDCVYRKTDATPSVALVKSGAANFYHAGSVLVEDGSYLFTLPAFPAASATVISSKVVEGAAGATANKEMTASLTTADGQVACATALANKPFQSGFVTVEVNGVRASVARTAGEKTTKDSYFSADGGTTALSMGVNGTIAAGALLYWNGSVAGYQLATTDIVDFDYAVDPNSN